MKMSLKIREELQLKTAVGQSLIICTQPLGSNSTVSFVKKSKSLDSIQESSALKLKQSNNIDVYSYHQAEQTIFPQALPLVPLTKNEALLYEYGEARLVPSKDWNLCNADSCPPMQCETSNLSELTVRDKSNMQLGIDSAYMEEDEVGKGNSTSHAEFFSDENVNNQDGNIRQYALGRDFDEMKRVEITEKLCVDLLLSNQKLEEENKRLLSHDANLEKRMSEISKKLFMWENNYSKHRKAVAKLEIELQDIEQEIESKDQRIAELNRTIEALWITADELADRKVELTVKIGALQNQLKGVTNQLKERDDQLTENRKEEEIVDMSAEHA